MNLLMSQQVDVREHEL